MSFLVYVAQPIDQAKGMDRPTWPVPAEWTLYQPALAFSGAK